ncbi:F-box protein [Tanacetum coccineum]|uniref:F-box protein n=1 Tax=Tanacetum coccineum TaxID=301880 RepID=A0ABQ5FXU7_9ASTR
MVTSSLLSVQLMVVAYKEVMKVLVRCWSDGDVVVNVEKAMDSFLKGAACGSTLAMVDAGLVYWEIGKKDEGVRMYKRAAELGDPAGQCNLGISYLQVLIEALPFS